MVSINIWAVIVAAVVMFVIGGIWYGPLFGKQWAKLIGMSDESMKAMRAKGMSGMAGSYILMFVGALVMCFVLASTITSAVYFRTPHIGGVAWGFHTAFWAWLGFIAPVTLGTVLWEKKSWKLWLLNNGYWLVALLVAGFIIGSWM